MVDKEKGLEMPEFILMGSYIVIESAGALRGDFVSYFAANDKDFDQVLTFDEFRGMEGTINGYINNWGWYH